MKYKKILLVSVVWVWAYCPNLPAQTMFRNKNVVHLIDMLNAEQAYDEDVVEIKGTPFHNNKFVMGSIIYTDGDTTEVPVRYNIFEDRIEYYKDEQVMELMGYPAFQKVTVEDETFIVGSHEEGKTEERGYYQLLAEGKISLLAKLRVKLYDEVPPKPMQDAKPARFERKPDDYLVQLADGTIQPFKKVKQLISLLENHKSELTKYAKEHKISSGNPEELAQLINYYNSL